MKKNKKEIKIKEDKNKKNTKKKSFEHKVCPREIEIKQKYPTITHTGYSTISRNGSIRFVTNGCCYDICRSPIRDVVRIIRQIAATESRNKHYTAWCILALVQIHDKTR